MVAAAASRAAVASSTAIRSSPAPGLLVRAGRGEDQRVAGHHLRGGGVGRDGEDVDPVTRAHERGDGEVGQPDRCGDLPVGQQGGEPGADEPGVGDRLARPARRRRGRAAAAAPGSVAAPAGTASGG